MFVVPRRGRRSACVIGYVLHTHIIGWFMKTVPNDVLKNQGDTLYTFTPAESFMTTLWISIYFGFVLALPVDLLAGVAVLRARRRQGNTPS